MSQCKHVLASGKQCGGLQISNSDFCFAHTPGLDEARFLARQKGGRANRKAVLPSDVPDFALESAADVGRLIAGTINNVRRGELDARLGNAVGYLAWIFLRAREVGEFEDRLKRLEDTAGIKR